MKTSIWVEKYRPKNLSDVIFQDEKQEKQFMFFKSEGIIPNLLLSGVQGTGKTSTSGALLNDLSVDKTDILRINCSDKKIDSLRNEVTAFAMSLPFGKFKVVQLEETDYLLPEAQGLLRSLIEDVSASCRFIATCNYDNKIIPALKSRFQQFVFKAPDKEKVAIRAAEILEKESIEFTIEDLLTFVDVGYPDVRKIIQLLQSNSIDGKLLSPSSIKSDADWKFALLDLIQKGDFKTARKVICNNSSKEEHIEVYTFLYQNIDKLKIKDHDSAIITIADYMAKHSLVADTEINLAACIISLSRL